MAITRVADLSFTAGASTTTTTIKSSAAFGSIVVGDRVYNSTRGAWSRIATVPDTSTITLANTITGQVAGDSIVISPAIQVTGNYSNGTSTGITATSLTDTSKSWTTSALVRRTIRLTNGTHSGALGYVSANTGTVATVEQWTWFNTTTKAFEIVTPTGTPTYEVGQNWDDVVTALGSDVVWLQTTSKRHIRMTGGSAPLKFTSGTLLASPEPGAVEFLVDHLYFTQVTDSLRKKIAAFDDANGAQGDMYYRDASGSLLRIPIGTNGQALAVNSGVPTWSSVAGGSTRFALDFMFNEAYNTSYAEVVNNVGGDPIQVGVWVDNTKALKLFTKDIYYSGDEINQIVITNNITNETLTTIIGYIWRELYCYKGILMMTKVLSHSYKKFVVITGVSLFSAGVIKEKLWR